MLQHSTIRKLAADDFHDKDFSVKRVEYKWEFCNELRSMLHVGQTYGTENRDSALLSMHIFRWSFVLSFSLSEIKLGRQFLPPTLSNSLAAHQINDFNLHNAVFIIIYTKQLILITKYSFDKQLSSRFRFFTI